MQAIPHAGSLNMHDQKLMGRWFAWRALRRILHRASLVLIFGVLLFCPACTGTAKLSLISLNSQAIDPPRVQPFDIDASESYWWTDDSGDLCIAIHAMQRNLLFGKLGDVSIDFSMVLGKPPAGIGRDYPLRQREVRLLISSVMQNQRFIPLTGIAAILTKPGDQIHGTFRVWMNPVIEVGVLSFLPPKPGPILCYGTFKAVRDGARGASILKRSEEFGLTRPPKDGEKLPDSQTEQGSQTPEPAIR